MKPTNWNDLSSEEQQKIGRALIDSPRGRWILAQALELAMEALKTVPEEDREVSNIEDMEILRDTVFGPYYRSGGVLRAIPLAQIDDAA